MLPYSSVLIVFTPSAITDGFTENNTELQAPSTYILFLFLFFLFFYNFYPIANALLVLSQMYLASSIKLYALLQLANLVRKIHLILLGAKMHTSTSVGNAENYSRKLKPTYT